MRSFLNGAKDGVPIALGYLSVSFTFGLMAVDSGLSWWQATLISMANMTSAGQFAGLGIMIASGGLIEMMITQLVINLRYALMAISLSQNVDKKVSGVYRWIFGAGITDEIFAVSVSKTYKVSRSYLAGIILTSYSGWVLGTLLGALLGGILPESVNAALGLAIYGMFVAIVVPRAKVDKKVLAVVGIAIALSCLFTWTKGLNKVSSGFVIIICSVLAAGIGAVFFPEDDAEREEIMLKEAKDE